MVITESILLKKGRSSYIEKSEFETALLKSIDAIPVQRNKGIDGFLKSHYAGKPVPVKIQTADETLEDAKEKLEKASKGKGYQLKILVQTKEETNSSILFGISYDIEIIKANQLEIEILKRKMAVIDRR